MAATPVFADVDTGVDDAIALIYLLASPDAHLVGIASTAGNVGVEHVCENNLSLLDLCRVDGVPVSRGAERPLNSVAPADSAVHGSRGLDTPNCRRPIGNSTPMMPQRRGYVRPTRTRAN